MVPVSPALQPGGTLVPKSEASRGRHGGAARDRKIVAIGIAEKAHCEDNTQVQRILASMEARQCNSYGSRF